MQHLPQGAEQHHSCWHSLSESSGIVQHLSQGEVEPRGIRYRKWNRILAVIVSYPPRDMDLLIKARQWSEFGLCENPGGVCLRL